VNAYVEDHVDEISRSLLTRDIEAKFDDIDNKHEEQGEVCLLSQRGFAFGSSVFVFACRGRDSEGLPQPCCQQWDRTVMEAREILPMFRQFDHGCKLQIEIVWVGFDCKNAEVRQSFWIGG
jgi:hypothetical protein